MKAHTPPWKIKELKIEVTHKCTLQCKHCSNDASPAISAEIQTDKCLNIISEAKNMSIKEMAISGGEPLIWDGLEEVCSEASKAGMNLTVYSAGYYPCKDEKMQMLKNAGVNRIIFSIFGSNSATHDAVTMCHGSFRHTLDAVKSAIESALEVEFHFVPLSENYNEFESILKLAERIGVHKISVLRFVPQGRGQLIKGFASLDKLQNIQLKWSIEKAREKGFNVRTGSPYNFLLLNRENASCPSGIDRAIIGPDLRIYPCDAFKQIKAEEIADTLEFSSLEKWSLEECWEYSPFFNAIREYLTTPFPQECQECGNLDMCLSGCLAQKVLVSGKLRKQPDPMCILGKGAFK